MKKRQIENGKNQSGNLNNIESRPNGQLPTDKTSTRKELAKLANTSEGFDIVSSNRTAQICVF